MDKNLTQALLTTFFGSFMAGMALFFVQKILNGIEEAEQTEQPDDSEV